METIIWADKALFNLANARLTTSFLDFFMPFITQKSNFVEVIVVGWLLIFVLGRGKEKQTFLIVVLVIICGDLISSTFKDLFQRVRPCTALDSVRLLTGCGGSYSFPSNHATNISAAMVYLSYHYSRFMPLFLLVAALVAYSRVYVGVHYPLDILAGAALGTLVSLAFILMEERCLPHVIEHYKRLRTRN